MDASGSAPISALLDQLRADARRIAEVLDAGPLDAPVPTCPGWDLAALAGHLGGVHRWATHIVRTGERPERGAVDLESGRDAGLGAWLLDGAETLATTLESTDPDAPVWNPFGAPEVAALWPRRQAHETMVHRLDAELAVGSPTALPAELASDGIDELFEVMIPGNVARGAVTLPSESLHVHCTDVHGEWLLENDAGRLSMRREHAKGAAAVRGPAESLLLVFWRRMALDHPSVEVLGDADAAQRWSQLTS